jgi:hypothetical protein
VKGAASGRDFDPDLAGGQIRRLSAGRVRVTDRGIDVIERHLARFGTNPPNQAMIRRLRSIAAGRTPPTRFDLNFYTHELREFVRYRRLGWQSGEPSDTDAAYDLWNHAHTATLEDYALRDDEIYHPDSAP